MLILEPDIRIDWGEELLTVHSFLYLGNTYPKYRGMVVGDDKPIPVTVTITGKDTPSVEIHNRTLLEHIPGAMDAVSKWVGTHGLIAIWKHEMVMYLHLRRSVHLPGEPTMPRAYVPARSRFYLQYSLAIEVPNTLPSMVVELVVDMDGAVGKLLIAAEYCNEYGEYVDNMALVDTYQLGLPVTVEGIKAKVRGTLEQYLNCL